MVLSSPFETSAKLKDTIGSVAATLLAPIGSYFEQAEQASYIGVRGSSKRGLSD
jgi:hypothetical protein